ncbi:MAG: hypothetical protein ACXADB_09375, partial [Candidatus Hermodarchaeia archaeon]
RSQYQRDSLINSMSLSELTGSNVLFKLETLRVTRAFKTWGAANNVTVELFGANTPMNYRKRYLMCL